MRTRTCVRPYLHDLKCGWNWDFMEDDDQKLMTNIIVPTYSVQSTWSRKERKTKHQTVPGILLLLLAHVLWFTLGFSKGTAQLPIHKTSHCKWRCVVGGQLNDCFKKYGWHFIKIVSSFYLLWQNEHDLMTIKFMRFQWICDLIFEVPYVQI